MSDRQDAEDPRDQVPAPLRLLPLVPHHAAVRVHRHGDVSDRVRLTPPEHAAQLPAHGVGGG